MNELIKIEIKNERQTVSGRDLHEFLEVDTQYTKWIERLIEKYDFVENSEFYTISQKRLTVQGNQTTYKNHYLTLNCAKEISMISNTNRGRQARQYFIKCEEKLKQQTVKLPQNYLEALKALVVSEEEKEQLMLENATMKPKVDYYDEVLQSSRLSSFTEVAKDLGMTAQQLGKFLQDERIIFKKNGTYHLYRHHNNLLPTCFDYHITKFGQNLKITERGRKFIIDKINFGREM